MSQMKVIELKMTVTGVPEKNVIKFFQSQTVTDNVFELPENFITYNFNKNHVVTVSDFLRRHIIKKIHSEELSEEQAVKIEPIQIYGCPSNVVRYFTYKDQKIEILGTRDGLTPDLEKNIFTIEICLKDPSQYTMGGMLRNLGINLDLQLSSTENNKIPVPK